DPVNYSCAYDSLFVCVYDIWDEYRSKWSVRMQRNGTYFSQLTECFEAVHGGSRTIERARDIVREMLTRDFPVELPLGPEYIALNSLARAMLVGHEWGTINESCLHCDVRDINSYCFSTYQSITENTSVLLLRSADTRCPSCGKRAVSITTMREAPPLLFFGLPDRELILDPSVMMPVQGVNVRYHLRGVVYYADHHFTCRVLKGNGDFWYHDGI
ncbi:hypothetical protein B0H12DRAFT_971210, partial [Mycena haematopus]